MTRIKLQIAALLAACLISSLTVVGLAAGEEPGDSQQDQNPPTVTMDDLDAEERREVEQALEAVPWDEIRHALADVRGALAEVDAEAIRAEVEAAMAEVDLEEIRAEVRETLEEVDWDEIRQEIESARVEIRAVDFEEIRAEVREALEEVDWDEIRRTMEEAEGIAAEELGALDELLEDLDGSGAI